MRKKVSFIIATYNGEKFLRRTVDCAINQKEVDSEIIIIDDKSQDSTSIIAKEISKNFDNVVFCQNEKNRGFCKTVNIGIKQCTGDYIMVLDQDDVIDTDHCSKMLPYFENENVVMVFCDHYLIDENDNVFNREEHCLHRDFTIKDFIKGNPVPVPGFLIRRSSLSDVGGYPENNKFPHYGEYHTWVRLAMIGRVAYCPEVVSYYRRHSDNMTNSFVSRKVRYRLAKYYWSCRKQLFAAKEIGFGDRLKILLYTIRNFVALIKC